MNAKITINDVDPDGYWRSFAALFPDAAKAINQRARLVLTHNRGVASTHSHGVASVSSRFNGASVLRSNIATGYLPADSWKSVAAEWTI